jgi:hypothetical protein
MGADLWQGGVISALLSYLAAVTSVVMSVVTLQASGDEVCTLSGIICLSLSLACALLFRALTQWNLTNGMIMALSLP